MAGLVPAIHVLLAEQQTWMPGTSPGMAAYSPAQPFRKHCSSCAWSEEISGEEEKATAARAHVFVAPGMPRSRFRLCESSLLLTPIADSGVVGLSSACPKAARAWQPRCSRILRTDDGARRTDKETRQSVFACRQPSVVTDGGAQTTDKERACGTSRGWSIVHTFVNLSQRDPTPSRTACTVVALAAKSCRSSRQRRRLPRDKFPALGGLRPSIEERQPKAARLAPALNFNRRAAGYGRSCAR